MKLLIITTLMLIGFNFAWAIDDSFGGDPNMRRDSSPGAQNIAEGAPVGIGLDCKTGTCPNLTSPVSLFDNSVSKKTVITGDPYPNVPYKPDNSGVQDAPTTGP